MTIDLSKYKGMTPGEMWFAIKKDFEFAMPPVGMSVCRTRRGEVVTMQYTVRCGFDNCWFVGHGAREEDARKLLDEHECPTPPRRNELASGRSTLEKLWNEMDDVTAALINKTSYNNMDGEKLRGYAQGIAFNLTMMTQPYFKTIKEVAIEARARYQMSKGEIPFRPTPSYRYNPMSSATPGVVSTKPVEAAPPKKAPVQRRSAAAKAAPPPVDDATAAMLKVGASGGFSAADLALMYGLTTEQVKSVIGA